MSEKDRPIVSPDKEQEKTAMHGAEKRNFVVRLLSWLLRGCLYFLTIFILLSALLYVPFVQDWAVGVACDKIGESTGMDVSVDRVRLSFPLDVDLQELCITQRDTLRNVSTTDTVLAVRHCIVDLDMLKVFQLRIGVDEVTLKGVVVDSRDLIASLRLKGSLKTFEIDAHDLQFKECLANVTSATLDGCDLDIAMQDTTIIDTTTSEPLMWNLNFGDIALRDTRVAFHTAGDTMSVRASICSAELSDGSFDIGHNKLRLSDFDMRADSVLYDLNYESATESGLDVNHIALYDISASVPFVDYDLDAGHLKADLSKLSVREKCGFDIRTMSAKIDLDTTKIVVEDAVLKTPSSSLRACVNMDWSALTPKHRGRMNAELSADFSREDVLALAGSYMPESVVKNYPDRLLTAAIELEGNVDHVDVKSFGVKMPGMIEAYVRGAAGDLVSEGAVAADLDWEIHTQDLSLLKRVAGLTGVNLPPMDICGTTNIGGEIYSADVQLRQGKGLLKAKGWYNSQNDAYKADVDVRNLAVSRFVPMDSTFVVSANVKAKGRGFDLLSRTAKLDTRILLSNASYGSANVGDVQLEARLDKGEGLVNLFSGGDVVDADGCVEFSIVDKKLDSAAFSIDLRALDLYTLHLTKHPLKASMTMRMKGNSNLQDVHYVKGDVSGMRLLLADTTYYPKDINLEALLNPDTTYAFLSAGDLDFRLNSSEGLGSLVSKFTEFADSVTYQMEQRDYHQTRLTRLLPNAELLIKSGQQNPLNNFLRSMYGYTFQSVDIDMHTNPVSGINGNGAIFRTNTGAIVLDTICFDLRQDTAGLLLDARVANNKRNKDVTFLTTLQAQVKPGAVGCNLQFFDAQGTKGVDLGAMLSFTDEAVRLHITPLRPIIAYRYFTVNEDNFLSMSKGGHYDANLDLLADDGTGLKLFSTPNEEAQQDLTASLNHFNLGELCSVMPYMPRITGFLQGDVRYLQSDITTILADVVAQGLTYEGYEMGNVGLNAAYLPNEDGTHFVDGYISQNDNQVVTFNGTYYVEGNSEKIDAEATVEHLPLHLANAFLDETINLTGDLDGYLHVTGSLSQPRLDGVIATEGLHVISPMYSINMRVEDDSIKVAGSKLNLNKIVAYTTGANPLTMDGFIDFSNLSDINLDITAKAKNFELINAQKTRGVAAYGKVYVDLNARARGTLNDLDVTGSLGVLGNTNVTYVLIDSPITVEDEMSDLVTFCDFGDTIKVADTEFVPPSNMNMRFNVSVDKAAQVNCLLSEDGANYIKLEGGGDLLMTYNDVQGMKLNGRYTILDGRMTYTLMVVSLKDCVIENGSYVEFNGDIMNPRLNIVASERVNSSIVENDVPRTVGFDVGLTISQTLEDMGLEFTLDAPEDMSVQNQIAQMTLEQRSRVAVTLMATGMYIVEGQASGGFNTTNALNAFLQSQIASITGKALKTVDLSLGVQNNATASGGMTTDYTFRFAKRFWGNRISVIVGGKVSSGQEAVNTGQSIIDNVSVEYRLDKSATRYVTLYYDKNNKSVLEGEIVEMGAGLVLRRTTDRLGELFMFRTKKDDDEQ